MKKEIIVTADGSQTISIPEKKLTYHSLHGAMQESMHVFIEAGLMYAVGQREGTTGLKIFEMGFGTGLNAFLTAIKAEELALTVHYTTIETSALSSDETSILNYASKAEHNELFKTIHSCQWNELKSISPHFVLEKRNADLLEFSTSQLFHVIYYDAFAPSGQPELWTKDVFEKLLSMLHVNGILVTYCSKADVRRAMMAAGFTVKKIPGPRGKREMVRAMRG